MTSFLKAFLKFLTSLDCRDKRKKSYKDTSENTTRTPLLAIGHDLPPELFDHILKFVVSTDAWAPPEGPWTSLMSQIWLTKRELGMWALTCRHWNSRCQPLIFDTIRLRSRSDVYDLLDFFKREDCKVVQYIRLLIVEQTGTSHPWIHLVELELDSIMDHRRRSLKRSACLLELKLDSPFPLHLKRGYRVRSVNAILPRSPPRSVARYGTLHLSNINFHHFEDLMRLVAEMPNLSELRGRKLTWADDPQTRPPQRSAKVLFSVVFTECSNNWAPVWLMTGATWPRPSFPHKMDETYMLRAHENITLHKICRCISEGVDSIKWPLTAMILESCRYPSAHTIEYENVIERTATAVQVGLAPKLSFSCAVPKEIPPEGVRFARIEVVTVDFRGLPLLEDALSCKWKDFDEHVRGFTALHRVIFGFGSQNDVSLFVKDILDPLMPGLQRSEKLILAVPNRKRAPQSAAMWLVASRDEESSDFTYAERGGAVLLRDL